MSSAFASRLPFHPLLAALGLCLAAVSAPAAAPAEVREELEDSGAPRPAPATPAAPAPVPLPDTAAVQSKAADTSATPATPAASGAPAAPAAAAAAAATAADGTAAGDSAVLDSAARIGGPATPLPAGQPAGAPGQPLDAAAGPVVPTPTSSAAENPGDLTIEVDESRSRNEGKSLPLAMLYSAVLPGAGEMYLQEKGRAKTFLLVEAGFWAALYVSFVAKDSYLQSARNHASQYAGIDAGSKDEDFLETMGTYRSYQEKQHRQDSYELAQVLQNKRERDYDIAPVPENYWDFGSSANPENTRRWREFQSTLRYYRASKVAMSFALGALAMNRLASMVNTLQTYKRTSARSASWDFTPELGPEYAGARLSLRF